VKTTNKVHSDPFPILLFPKPLAAQIAAMLRNPLPPILRTSPELQKAGAEELKRRFPNE